MKINVSVKLNEKNIKKIEDAMIKALPLTIDAVKTEVNNMQVIPKNTGTLEFSVFTIVNFNKAAIGWNTKYARRLYYNPQFNFRTDKNINAQGRWMDSFKYGDKKEWMTNVYGRFIIANSGGVIR